MHSKRKWQHFIFWSTIGTKLDKYLYKYKGDFTQDGM